MSDFEGQFELPRFRVQDGVLLDHPTAPIEHGFVLEEDGRLLDPYRMHEQHTAVASDMLEEAGCVEDPICELETHDAYLLEQIKPHTDGLTFEFYQAQTTRLSRKSGQNDQGGTELWLGIYALGEDEHEGLRVVHDTLNGPGPLNHVYLGDPAVYREDTLSSAIGHAPPVAEWTTVARAQMATIIFRNGYDATPASAPTDLYIHAGRTVGRPKNDTGRRSSMSRIVSRP